MTPAQTTLPYPEFVGQYRITGWLGRGNYWQVLAATHEELRRPVAVKIPRLDGLDDSPSESHAAAWWGFLRDEGVRLARLRAHRHVVGVVDFGLFEWGGVALPFLAMQVVDGGTLADYLARSPVPPDVSVAIAAQVVSGVAAIHADGLTHRDVKPDNVLVAVEPSDGWDRTAVVTDLSLSSLAVPPCDRRTPQAWRQKDVADCCRWLHAMLVNGAALPDGPVHLPRQVRVAIARPHHLEWVLTVGLGRHPARRFDAAGELERALMAYRRRQIPIGYPAGLFEPSALLCRRHPVVSGVVGTAIVGLAVAGIYAGVQRYDRAEAEEGRAAALAQVEWSHERLGVLGDQLTEVMIRNAVHRGRELAADRRAGGAPDQTRLQRIAFLEAELGGLREDLAGRGEDPSAGVALRVCDAISAWAAGRYEQAVGEADPAALAAVPEGHRSHAFLTRHLHRVRGAGLMGLGRWPEAAAAFGEAARAAPDGWVDHALHGLCLKRVSDSPAAAAALGVAVDRLRAAEQADHRALLTPPLRAELLGVAGDLVLWDGRAGDAIPLLADAIASWEAAGPPDRYQHAHALIKLGLAYGKTGDADRAWRCLTRGIDLGSRHPEMAIGAPDGTVLTDAFLNRAEVSAGRRDHASAIRDLDAAAARMTKTGPSFGRLLARRAAARLNWVRAGARTWSLGAPAVAGQGAGVAVLSGTLTAAKRDADAALELLAGPAHPVDRAEALTTRGWAGLYLDDLDAAGAAGADAAAALAGRPAQDPLVRLARLLEDEVARRGRARGG